MRRCLDCWRPLCLRSFTFAIVFVSILNLLWLETLIRSSESLERSVSLKATLSATNLEASQWKERTSADTIAPQSLLEHSIAGNSSIEKYLWQDSDSLPEWMKEYFTWHKAVRQGLNESNWQSYKYLLLRCVARDKKCSGASDRLKAVPLAVRLASEANRMLFIAWTRPVALEEFLVPPAGGFDWTLPNWLAKKLNLNATNVFWFEDTVQRWPRIDQQIVRIKNLRGTKYYDDKRNPGELELKDVYHDIWSVIFQPSKPVQALIGKTRRELNLTKGNYVGVHVRALYVGDGTNNREEVNALNCAAELAPGLPIFFASDSRNTTEYALHYGLSHRAGVAARRTDKEPLHLDRGRNFLKNSNDWMNRPASDFYDIFVDLYLLADSKCMSYGVGGFGSWASLLSTGSNCSVNHRKKMCKWTSVD